MPETPAADTERLTLEVVDAKGKVLRTVEGVEATRVEKKDGAIGFVLKTTTLKGERPEAGWRLVDANKDTWTIKRAARGGQGESWSASCEKKKP
ncbi:hypothetical protein VT84_30645 [Gemmata sp. SH-PL17]|uniref:hypothetical protein n=1 Tax=Gemmata sp. SH-PL17 TaxID=1630693 RepID=UPI00078B84D9|nr:hypothetical protein [Gemmata sp. SH-PL17]AMV28792.1 hypothetical protein VT84_30645 [Gemmata sp. SH-PL17]